MSKLIPHIAIENGTVSNPYRFVEKGTKVNLTQEEAKFYKGSWLRQVEEGQQILNAPLTFPNIKITGNNGKDAMESIPQGSSQYNDQMKTLIEAEKAEDAAIGSQNKPKGEDVAAGTGDLDPLA